ncbi:MULTISPECIES: hypothetical protein [unclassified Desulfovibrio]|uniref:hypothetical protein n=1 Tax=unclassified Desulfovibrio TaxID=2593640 RepID=UPI000F5D5711|nr:MULTISPECIES: hypothetical protein [unclassified Desulfovibrio]RRD72297.1 hypothetical protein EII24_00030 [Desulfovibrio sp. OH1209_COT-279]RRD88408.1 hypothetical protein EII23_00030 [Desulfovibrio sp. OH1186_COT-070]
MENPLSSDLFTRQDWQMTETNYRKDAGRASKGGLALDAERCLGKVWICFVGAYFFEKIPGSGTTFSGRRRQGARD